MTKNDRSSTLLLPTNEVCEGYVITGVCLSTWGGMHGRGHAWWGVCGGGTCMVGGMHGRGYAWQGGMHGGGHAWQGVCMAGGYAWQGASMVMVGV